MRDLDRERLGLSIDAPAQGRGMDLAKCKLA
jgi:hypothetical protein